MKIENVVIQHKENYYKLYIAHQSTNSKIISQKYKKKTPKLFIYRKKT